MGLLDLIDNLDRLISDGRNISDLKPHLITLRDQAEALEMSIRKLQSKLKNHPLARECEELNAQLEQAQTEIRELKENTQIVHGSELSEIETKILVHLVNRDERTFVRIGEHISENAKKAEFLCTGLEEKGYVDCHWNWTGSSCSIRQEGLQYLDSQKLL